MASPVVQHLDETASTQDVLHALAAGGALGVAQMLRLLRDELEMAMALTGCRTLADAGPALLTPTAA